MRRAKAGGGWPAIGYALKKARQAGGVLRMFRALRSRNACKTCALGMGGQRGGMVNERGRFPEVCKKSVQAMAADLQGRIPEPFFVEFDLDRLRGFSSRELEAAGRLTEPLYAGPLDSHYRKIDWSDALDRVAAKMGRTKPAESFFYFSGRSSNEAGFLYQLVARLYGTNNINNCSYYCHQASGVALGTVTGTGTATVVLDDVHHCDLLFLIGANPSSNHPRLMRAIVDPSVEDANTYLPRHEPAQIKWSESERRYCHDSRVEQEVAREIAAQFEGSGAHRVRCIYGIPGSRLYLLTGTGSRTGEQVGLQFFLIRHDDAGLTILQESTGMQDSWFLSPVFFWTDDRVLVLADTGTEYSWGVVAFELRDATLRDLGVISVALDAEENTVDPLPSAKVRRTEDGYLVEFHANLVWNPGGSDERPLPREAGRPHLFRSGAGGFEPVSASGE